MYENLRAQGHEVSVIEPTISSHLLFTYARKAMFRMVGQRFHAERQHDIARELARSVRMQLERMPEAPDVILSSSSLPMAYLRTTIPMAFWTDATFASMLGFYEDFTELSAGTIRDGMELENLALARCDVAIYSSAWAARSAIADHRADPRKVHVVPFGPNLKKVPHGEAVHEAIAMRDRQVCKLVYIGYDWVRKQGDLVIQAQENLERKGIATELTIIGCDPDLKREHRRIRKLGLLDKDSEKDNALLLRTLSEAHFLVVPSKAECYGMVYAEASAYGLPSVAFDVGGVGTVVRNGKNGILLPPTAGAAVIAERIAALWSDSEAYQELAHFTRRDFDERINWSQCIEELSGILESSCTQNVL